MVTPATKVSSAGISTSDSASRWPASRTRTAPCASVSIRRRRPSTSTAGHTTSTISTSSTPPFSRQAPPSIPRSRSWPTRCAWAITWRGGWASPVRRAALAVVSVPVHHLPCWAASGRRPHLDPAVLRPGDHFVVRLATIRIELRAPERAHLRLMLFPLLLGHQLGSHAGAKAELLFGVRAPAAALPRWRVLRGHRPGHGQDGCSDQRDECATSHGDVPLLAFDAHIASAR